MSSAESIEDENQDNDDNDDEKSKTESESNSTEIIAALSLELLHASKDIYNPMTRRPFGVKFGKKYKDDQLLLYFVAIQDFIVVWQ